MSDTALSTEIKELQASLLEKTLYIDQLEHDLQDLQRRDRTKGEFLTGMGHAIRTPLNGIMGMTNLVLESDLTDEQRRHLEMATASSERLLSVVGDILDLYRIETGRLQLAVEDFNLFESLDYELYLLKLTAQQHNLELRYQVDRAIPELVNGDPDRFVRVIANLVDNAIKFTQQGQIIVNVDYLGIDENGQLMLKTTVTDTGVGIHRDNHGRIRNFLTGRADENGFARFAGGLGLTISSRLVQLAGGKIDFTSDPETGSSFWFTWKCNRSSGASSTRMMPQRRELSTGEAQFLFEGIEVLLVEDDPIGRVLIETLLQQAGIRVRVAENGRQAVAAVQAGGSQAVLMDVQMPDMDGLEATSEIRKYENRTGAGHLPIIALTAHALQGDRERCLQAGMDDYLAKPVSKGELYNVLYRYLTRSALVALGDPVSQQTAVEWLIEKGWRTTIAETGRSAQYEVSLSPFDLVLLDLSLDERQGLETVKLIRRLDGYAGRSSLIVGVHGDRMTDDLNDAYREKGVDLFLAMPLSITALQQVLALNRRSVGELG